MFPGQRAARGGAPEDGQHPLELRDRAAGLLRGAAAGQLRSPPRGARDDRRIVDVGALERRRQDREVDGCTHGLHRGAGVLGPDSRRQARRVEHRVISVLPPARIALEHLFAEPREIDRSPRGRRRRLQVVLARRRSPNTSVQNRRVPGSSGRPSPSTSRSPASSPGSSGGRRNGRRSIRPSLADATERREQLLDGGEALERVGDWRAQREARHLGVERAHRPVEDTRDVPHAARAARAGTPPARRRTRRLPPPRTFGQPHRPAHAPFRQQPESAAAASMNRAA